MVMSREATIMRFRSATKFAYLQCDPPDKYFDYGTISPRVLTKLFPGFPFRQSLSACI